MKTLAIIASVLLSVSAAFACPNHDDSGAPKTDYVRGEFTYGTFTLTSIEGGKKTRVLAEVLADPKGSVAKWIVNLFQKDWPHKTIESLRKQVAKPDIKDQARLKDMLAQAGY